MVGFCNYLICCLFSTKKFSKSKFKDYLVVYGYTSNLPLLLLGIFIIFWIYFFEKFYIATDITPYIDFTPYIIIFLVIFFSFISYKWILEIRINQAFFKINILKAIIPELIQIIEFIGFYILLNLIRGYISSSLEIV